MIRCKLVLFYYRKWFGLRINTVEWWSGKSSSPAWWFKTKKSHEEITTGYFSNFSSILTFSDQFERKKISLMHLSVSRQIVSTIMTRNFTLMHNEQNLRFQVTILKRIKSQQSLYITFPNYIFTYSMVKSFNFLTFGEVRAHFEVDHWLFRV